MSADVRPPIAGARLWLAVMDRASQSRKPAPGAVFDGTPAAQCECTGQCGKHAGARCPRTHGEYRKRGGPLRLLAAPADLTLDGTPAAARLGVDDLRAWCPGCHNSARQAARKPTAEPLSWLARVIRDGSEGERTEAWIRLAAANGTGMARDIWSLAEQELAAAAEQPRAEAEAELVQEGLF